MTMKHTNILNSDYWYETITAYMQRELSEQEVQKLIQWKSEKQEHGHFFEEIKNSWEASREKKQFPEFDTLQAWNKVKAQTIDLKTNDILPFWKQVMYAPFTKAAAAVLVLGGITWAMSNVVFTKPSFTDLQSFGGMKEFYLPDSSKVYLNDTTTLRYASSYGEDERMVYLDGEAFFEVRKDPSKKFTVLSFKSRVIVKGTSFLVRSRSKDSVDVVEVEEGKVAVLEKYSRTGKELMLTKGMTCSVDIFGGLKKGNQLVTKTAAWRNSEWMNFIGTPLNLVLKELKSKKGVDVVLANKEVGEYRFTGEFDNATTEEIVQVIALSMNLNVEKQGDVYVLKADNSK